MSWRPSKWSFKGTPLAFGFLFWDVNTLTVLATGVAREAAACARIRNPFTDSLMVMVSGGFNDVNKKYLDSVEFWDTETNEVIFLANNTTGQHNDTHQNYTQCIKTQCNNAK